MTQPKRKAGKRESGNELATFAAGLTVQRSAELKMVKAENKQLRERLELGACRDKGRLGNGAAGIA